MDRLFPKFNRKSQPIAVIRAKRELRRKNRERPPEVLPGLKLHNSECIAGADFDQLYGCIRDWKWLPQSDKPKLDLQQARDLLRDMQKGVVMPRVESVSLAMDALIGNDMDVKEYLPVVPKGELENGVLAFIKAKEGNLKHALTLLAPLKEVSTIAMYAYEQVLERVKDVKIADLIFTNLAGKCVPSTRILNQVIWIYTQNDYVEKALKAHTDMCRKGFVTTGSTFKALIECASNRKETFMDMTDYFRQAVVRQEPICLSIWNNMLFGCSKLGNLDTALQVWKAVKECGFYPGLKMYSTMLWALASCETKQNKLSVHRDYFVNVKLQDLVQTGKELRQEMQQNNIQPNASCLTAYLALMCNARAKEEAEWTFYEELAPMQNSPRQCEILASMYDSLKDYSGALRLLKHIDVAEIEPQYPFWRSIIRTMSMTGHVDEAAYLLSKHVPKRFLIEFKDMKELYYHAYMQARPDVLQMITNKAIDNVLKTFQCRGKKFMPLRRRSLMLGDFLKDAYGPQGPKVATDDPRTRQPIIKEGDLQFEYLDRENQ